VNSKTAVQAAMAWCRLCGGWPVLACASLCNIAPVWLRRSVSGSRALFPTLLEVANSRSHSYDSATARQSGSSVLGASIGFLSAIRQRICSNFEAKFSAT
jgi:hypothetical protein